MSDLYMSYKILESNEMHFKTCTKCGKTLPATTESFHKDKRGKYGLRSICKKCASEQSKQHYEDNKDKIAEQHKQYYKSNKGKIEERRKQWYKDNKGKILEQSKQYCVWCQKHIAHFTIFCFVQGNLKVVLAQSKIF